MGPFSEPVLIRVDPEFLYFNPNSKTSTAATTTSKRGDGTPMTNPEVVSPPELAPRFNLILQVRTRTVFHANLVIFFCKTTQWCIFIARRLRESCIASGHPLASY